MQIAVHVLSYNVNTFLPLVLKNMHNHVDKIYIAYSHKPFGYNKKLNDDVRNPTSLNFVQESIKNLNCKVEVIIGEWEKEEQARNECLSKAKTEGFDWFLIQDADEFYTEEGWARIINYLKHNIHKEHIITTWYNFWKSPQFVMTYKDGGIKGTNAGFAINCKSNITFLRKRVCDVKERVVLDFSCYHYGYVMSNKAMEDKINTWGHTNELFSKKWYKEKWLNWNSETKFLHPVNPDEWISAIYFPLEQPNFASNLETFELNNFERPFSSLLNNSVYDAKAKLYFIKKNLKGIIKSTMR